MSIIFTYHDCCLLTDDWHVLADPASWWNDNIMSFCFEYLEREGNLDASCALVQPATLMFMSFATSFDDIAMCLEPLALPSKSTIIMPLNNNTDITSAGGSHWSLLVFHRPSATMFHLDSVAGSGNEAIARNMYKRVLPAMGVNDAAAIAFVPVATPQQQNGNDCGVIATLLAEEVATGHVQPGKADAAWAGLDALVAPEAVAAKRKAVLHVCSALAKAYDERSGGE